MNKWLNVLCLTVCMAGGCVSNTNPVLKPEQLITDPSLLGKWIETDKDQHTTVDVRPPAADKSAQVLYANIDKEDNIQHDAVMRLGKIGDLEVVEFKVIDADKKKTSYLWAIVRQADAKQVVADTLQVDWLKKYLTDHPGELQATVGTDDVTITASTDDFQKFLLKHAKDDGAFSAMHWVRPGAATQPATAPAVGGG